MQFENAREGLRRASPLLKVRDLRLAVLRHRADMTGCIWNTLGKARHGLESSAAVLDSLSPLSILARGYAIALTEPGGRVIREAGAVRAGEDIRVKLSRGSIPENMTAIRPAKRAIMEKMNPRRWGMQRLRLSRQREKPLPKSSLMLSILYSSNPFQITSPT